MLDRLERLFGRFAVPHLAVALAVGETLTLLLHLARTPVLGMLGFEPAKVMAGEYWRLFTFLLMPPCTNPLLCGFALYLFYIYGSTLEARWGHFRFTLYVLIAAVATIALGWLAPGSRFGIGILHTSIFLAFAYLNPEFELSLYFLLPVKIKYFALVTWLGLGAMLLIMPLPYRLVALGTVANFMLFFWRDVLNTIRTNQRRTRYEVKRASREKRALHHCAACGATEQTHPREEFRVCSQCPDGKEYCSQHLRRHDHPAP